ncbi:MAG: DnaA N-terminal domain-containing protein [Oscillospiraceae bacterium]
MDSLNSVWQSILAEISKNITSTAYNTWFADCSPVSWETNMVIQTTSDSSGAS